MESKKKRFQTPKPPKWKLSLLFFTFFFFFFFFFFNGRFSKGTKAFQPQVLSIHPLSLLPIQNSRSEPSSQLKVIDRVSFPDHVLLLIPKNYHQFSKLHCVYGINTENELTLSVLSMDVYNDLESIVRCPSPPTNYSALVNLRKQGNMGMGFNVFVDRSVQIWDSLVYEAVLDGKTAVVFAKGLNLRANRASDASQFTCHFGWGNAQRNSTKYVLTTKAITAAQEVVRCTLPKSLSKLPGKAHGVRVTLGHNTDTHLHRRLPSVAKLIDLKERNDNKKYELCVCTMVYNQASSLREWITYHAWLGVERWFIYDNNSDDGIKDIIDELDRESYKVSRYVWPWIKTQEAGFSHCAIKAKNECKWVGFIDVDEYFYFPVPGHRRREDKLVYPGRNSLKSLVSKFSPSTVGEIRTACHSFGPSGLTKTPRRGLTVGYTCRLQSPERHKSIIRPDALDETLLTVVHHFHLRQGYRSFNLPQSTAVLNHYKYQVWEAFRAKFYRRVATYVADWQENQNEGSKDRAPGLGTEAIEPKNWSRQFCEVWDTGLRDFIVANLADQDSGLLPWERSTSI